MSPAMGGPKRRVATGVRRRVTGTIAITILLAAAVAAARMSTAPDDHGALEKEIARQRAVAGRLVAQGGPAAQSGPAAHRWEQATASRMIETAKGYERDIGIALERGEAARVSVRRTRDILRINCVEDKVLQMRVVAKIVAPRFVSLPQRRQAELAMRSEMPVIELSWERMRELTSDIEMCFGDSVDMGSLDRFSGGGEGSTAGQDPTEPPKPQVDIDRPP